MSETPESVNELRKNEWMIRPCFIYNDEHSECTSMKGRFHQYFIYGESLNCDQWKTDYGNCKLWQKVQDETAFIALIRSEEERRKERLAPHYANTVWKKRENPPDDWNKPIPEWLQKRNEFSYLAVKADEMKGIEAAPLDRHLCTIL